MLISSSPSVAGTPTTWTSAMSACACIGTPPSRGDRRFPPPRMTMSLDAPDDLDVAVFVHHGEVAGVHPAVVVDRFGGALGHLFQ